MRLYLMPASGLNSKVVTTGPGIDLRDVAADVEFHALLFDGVGAFLQFVLVHLLAALGVGEQRGRGQLVSGLARRDFRLGRFFLRGRQRHGFVFVEFDDRGGAAGVVARFFGFALFFLLVFGEFLGGNALPRHGRTSGDLDFFHALAQAIGFAGFAPILHARPELAQVAIIGHRFLHPGEGRAERKTGGEKKCSQQGGDRN